MKFYISKDDLDKLQSGYAGHATVSSYAGTGLVEVLTVELLSKEGINICKKTWLETIKTMGSPREFITASEEQLIARALQIHGLECVELALFGARFEPATDSFKPSEHIDIARILMSDKQGKPRIQRFVEFGARGKASVFREEIKIAKRELEKEEPCDPAKVREILAAAGFGGRSA